MLPKLDCSVQYEWTKYEPQRTDVYPGKQKTIKIHGLTFQNKSRHRFFLFVLCSASSIIMAALMGNFAMDNTPDMMSIMADTKKQMAQSNALPDTPAPNFAGGYSNASVQEFHHLENTLSGKPITAVTTPHMTPAIPEDSPFDDIVIRIPRRPLDPHSKELSKILEAEIEQELEAELQKNGRCVIVYIHYIYYIPFPFSI